MTMVNHLIKYLNQCIIEYKQGPVKIVLGNAMEKMIINELSPDSIDSHTIDKFMGIPIELDYDDPYLVRMVYYIDARFPDNPEEDT